MRWAAKQIASGVVQWLYSATKALAEVDATALRTAGVINGSSVHVHQCWNDEPDATRQSCILTDRWEKQSGTWVKVL
jgi:hypothetical protein